MRQLQAVLKTCSHNTSHPTTDRFYGLNIDSTQQKEFFQGNVPKSNQSAHTVPSGTFHFPIELVMEKSVWTCYFPSTMLTTTSGREVLTMETNPHSQAHMTPAIDICPSRTYSECHFKRSSSLVLDDISE